MQPIEIHRTVMAEKSKCGSLEDLPFHLIMEILSSGQLSASDLVSLEMSCRMFRRSDEIFAQKFHSLVEFAAFSLSSSHSVFASFSANSKTDLLDRCHGNWKKLLRFLQSVEQSSGTVPTSSGNMQITTGRHHTFLVNGLSVYSCGSSLCGILGHGQHTTQSATFRRIKFPSSSNVIQVSASHNHAVFVMQSGEVFTCGDNSSLCCGHGEVRRAIFRPTRIEAMKGNPCVQAATGLSFTVLLTRDGQVYTCGTNSHGQLGHGDNIDRHIPKKVEALVGLNQSITQIAAGSSYTLAVSEDGTLFSFGSCSNFCLAHGDPHDQLFPRVIHSLRRSGVHVIRVSAADEHVVALDSSGQVYTWGRGYCGALGHGDENDKKSPEMVRGLRGLLSVQVCARKRKTFVVGDDGSVYAFGWMGFGSLGLAETGGRSDKVLRPRRLDCLKGSSVAQISTGLYHTVAITKEGAVLGFGDNERAQLGLEHTRDCLFPVEIPLHPPEDNDST